MKQEQSSKKAWPRFNIWKDLPIKKRQLTCLDWGLYLDFEMFTKNIKACKIWNCMDSCKMEPLQRIVEVSARDDHFMK